MPRGNLGNRWEFSVGYFQSRISWKFVKWVHKKCLNLENNQWNNSNILKKTGKVGNFASEKSWEPCSFVWEMVGDEDVKSWEMVWKLLSSKVWEACRKCSVFARNMQCCLSMGRHRLDQRHLRTISNRLSFIQL